MLGILLDAATIVFFMYMFKKCAVKSQLKNAVESLAFIASSVVSVPIGVFLGDFCYSSFFRPVIIERVESLVTTSGDVDTSMNAVERIMQGMPTMVNNGARIYKTTTGESLNQINKLLAGDLNTATGDIVDIISRPVIDGVVRALFFAIAFVGCYRLFRAFYPTIEAYFYNPDRAAVSPTNGMVLGSGRVVVIFLIILSLVQLVGPVLPDFILFRPELYSQSFIFKLFSENNLIMLFLGEGLTA